MKNSVKKALEIAMVAHKGQYDRAGVPYINHPYTVSKMVKGKKAKIVALLHDVIEDSSTEMELLEKFFTKDVCDAIRLLTRKKNQNYFTYVTALKNNELAKTVKLADLKHNMDVTRLDAIRNEDVIRLKKYLCAYRLLQK